MRKTDKQTAVRLWTIPFVLVILLNMLDGGIGMLTTSLVLEFGKSIGADETVAATAAGIMSLTSLFVCPIAGVVSDRVNRRSLLIFVNIGYAISLMLHFFVKTVPMLFLVRVLIGIFFSFVSVTLIAYVTAFVPRERMGEGLGFVALANIAAQAFGPGIGFWLADRWNYRIAFATAAVIAVICIFGLLVIPYHEDPHPKKEGRLKLENLFAFEFTGFMLLAALFSSCNGLVTTYLRSIATARNIAGVGMFYTLYSVVMVLLRPLSGKLLDKKGVYIILIPSVAFAALGMIFIGIGKSLPLILTAGVMKALGQGNGTPSLQAHAVKRLDKARAGVATSTIQIGQNIGNALAPICGSFIVKHYGYTTMFNGMGGLILIGGLLLILLQYKKETRSHV